LADNNETGGARENHKDNDGEAVFIGSVSLPSAVDCERNAVENNWQTIPVMLLITRRTKLIVIQKDLPVCPQGIAESVDEGLYKNSKIRLLIRI